MSTSWRNTIRQGRSRAASIPKSTAVSCLPNTTKLSARPGAPDLTGSTPVVQYDEVKSLEEYLALAAQSHGHMCPGQVLGVRMAMLGLRELGIDDPAKYRRRLLTFVEIDRCATDAVSLVTGCRLGKRSLKFVDYGKVAATFVDLETHRAVRVVARDDSRAKAK